MIRRKLKCSYTHVYQFYEMMLKNPTSIKNPRQSEIEIAFMLAVNTPEAFYPANNPRGKPFLANNAQAHSDLKDTVIVFININEITIKLISIIVFSDDSFIV